MPESNGKSSTVINITVSAAQAEKLYTAYCGLPDARRNLVKENAGKIAKERNLSAQESLKIAAFEEIFYPKLDHYFQKGVEAQKAIQMEAISMIGTLNAEQKKQLLEALGQQ